jgi:hypothetical protein
VEHSIRAILLVLLSFFKQAKVGYKKVLDYDYEVEEETVEETKRCLTL